MGLPVSVSSKRSPVAPATALVTYFSWHESNVVRSFLLHRINRQRGAMDLVLFGGGRGHGSPVRLSDQRALDEAA